MGRPVSGATSAVPVGLRPTRTPASAGPGPWNWPGRGDPSRAYAAAEELVATAEAEAKALNIGRDEAEADELRTALGPAAPAKGTAGTMRGPPGPSRPREAAEVPPDPASRDALDRALIDLATYFRDALLIAEGRRGDRQPPRYGRPGGALAAHASPERLLRCIEAVLECREALATNVKPKFAVDAMVATVGQALRSDL